MSSTMKRVIGLMSGTSLDGVDLVCVDFDTNALEDFNIQCSETVAYSEEWTVKLREAIHKNRQELEILDLEYGALLAQYVQSFIDKHALSSIDFIASHGHTILHRPAMGITLQIGNGALIAKITGLQVICDFRSQDVQLGGQGAPLVPIGDALLFGKYDACLNLGGFANVSYNKGSARIAFDISPVNIVLNHYCNSLGLAYDDKGSIAASGAVSQDLLNQLNGLPFYREKGPKSLGLEWVQAAVFPLIDGFNLPMKDILRTCIEHMACQIATVLSGRKEVLVTGGGVFNEFLMQRIAALSSLKISIPSNVLIAYKEALIFALLGVLKSEDQVNCLSSVTGAKHDHCSGVVFQP